MSRDPWNLDRQIGTISSWMQHVSGRYYGTQIATTSQTTVTPAIDTLYAQPFFVPATGTYDRISMEVTTQDAAEPNDIRVGIYNNTTNGATPSSLVIDGGELDLAGAAPFAIEATISQELSQGWYWLAYLTEGAAVFRGWTLGNMLPFLGTAVTTGTSNNYSSWSVAQAYGALPDPFTAGGALINTAPGLAKILLRKA